MTLVAQLSLPTAYVVRPEGNVFTRVCPSIHPSVCPHRGGGTPARSRQGGVGGYPSQVQAGGTPMGYHLGYPIGPGGYRRVPHLGYPHWTWLVGYPSMGYPPRVPSLPDLAGGYPNGGVHHLRYPHQTWPGGTLMGVPQ